MTACRTRTTSSDPTSSSGPAPRPTTMSGRCIPGATVAPFGAIQEDGVRLRVVAGYGADRYSGPRAVGAGSQIVAFKGTGSFADAPRRLPSAAGTADREGLCRRHGGRPPDPARRPRDRHPRGRPRRQDGAGDLVEPQRPGLDLRRPLVGLALPELRGAGAARLASHARAVRRARGRRRRQPRVRHRPRRAASCATNGERRDIGCRAARPPTSCWTAATAAC